MADTPVVILAAAREAVVTAIPRLPAEAESILATAGPQVAAANHLPALEIQAGAARASVTNFSCQSHGS